MKNDRNGTIQTRVAVFLACVAVAALLTPYGSAAGQSRATQSSIRGDEATWMKDGLYRFEKLSKELPAGKFVVSSSVRARAKEFYQEATRTLNKTRSEATVLPKLVKTRAGGGGQDSCDTCLGDGAVVGEIAYELCTLDGGSNCEFVFLYSTCAFMVGHCSPCRVAVEVCNAVEQ